ncbi:adenylate/guanylate cyclase domain-containing protein [Roseibium sp.]|uniref:adenylate/guanylate cyclase domain-containing protein n=1 Tax=Roseibium sp. TaxID=1936156 RepID=UPI003D0CC916
MERKLAAILAADVAGFSRLVGADEEGTLSVLRSLHTSIIEPLIREHRGRIVKFMGDGLLVEFQSAVDAVRCAVDWQTRLASCGNENALAFRIGINLGDIVVDRDDILGDGVNIAARLEGLADPGGIALSDMVFQNVRAKLGLEFHDDGLHTLKNIETPVRVWKWVNSASAVTKAQVPLPLPGKPSIAVLAFDNMSNDPSQEYFCDGVVEDLITELSKYHWLMVIARNTTFTFKGASVDVKDIGRQLGVRYVMEGSIRKSGDRVRITAQMVDAVSGSHVWAERYDREVADVFALQDEITQAVAGAIQPTLISAEADRARRTPPENMVAWDYAVRGRWHVLRLTQEDNAIAQTLLRTGLKHDPEHVPLLAFLSFGLINAVFFGWSNDPAAWLTEARELAEKAAALDENDVWVQCALGLCQFIAKQPGEAVGHLRKAIELNPSFALGHGYLALQLAYAGHPEEAIQEAETAIRLSPRDPELFHFYVAAGTAHFVAGRYEDAVEWAEKSVGERPAVPGSLRLLASSLALKGASEKARKVFSRVREISPTVSAAGIRNAIHFGNPEDLERYIKGLKMAGLPD